MGGRSLTELCSPAFLPQPVRARPRMDNMDEDDLERVKQRRLDEMKKMHKQKQQWLADGHGEYREIHGEKDFFKEAKAVDRVVAHFYRENWPCKVMDKHLSLLANRHVETKFVKIHAEKSPYLTEKLKVFMLPTLALVRKGKVVDYIVGFDDLGGVDDFKTETMALCLANKGGGMIQWQDGDDDYGGGGVDTQAPAPTGRSVRSGQEWGNMKRTDSDEDSDFD